MSNYPNVIEFHNNLINIIYPVGSIYMSVNNVSPATFLGGTWEQIQDTFLWCAGSKHSAGSTGGEETHTLSVAETPAHTHTRGTMDIIGRFWTCIYEGFTNGWKSGAFSTSIENSNSHALSGSTGWQASWVDLKASNAWTGATSSVGSGKAHNNMPPYLAVYVWKRIA